ncbi:MAG: hypothetical protein KDC03_22970 [Flavobacteriales bacterium]|nr:hypothetical protein [Flavobacteriales bacterium]
MRSLLLLLAVMATAAATAQSPCNVTLDDIMKHPGERVVFCGTPDEVMTPPDWKGDPVLLNFGGTYPEQAFSVVVWGELHGGTQANLIGTYAGQPVQVSGWVKEHDGVPMMYLKDLQDLQLQ